MSQTINTTVSGYSGTPLAKKLGLKAGLIACLDQAPDGYVDLLGNDALGVVWHARMHPGTDWMQAFVTEAKVLADLLQTARRVLPEHASLWISWPKKTSKRKTDVTEDRIRELALPLGWVDIKVCAVDEVWSGLKLVVRKELRSKK
ncbi:DUF3052 domain-containing protein [Ahniella affigens]|uniref:DUF3052 domain-containing protein n=1 Tax=Ahniella affigens TaxID=2021234 RepID=A0A2P1PXE9_9GAMM|nr:DUF3052 family protein [Ahniella affigens]AVP99521.1 DUF3052 domain-containing protein [Ahniella affigens]